MLYALQQGHTGSLTDQEVKVGLSRCHPGCTPLTMMAVAISRSEGPVLDKAPLCQSENRRGSAPTGQP